MDFRVLGPVEIRDDQDRVIGLRGQLDRALLALLLLNANTPVSVGSLASRMWEDRDPPKDGVTGYLQDLRKALRDSVGEAARVAPARGTTMITLDAGCVDVVRFREYLAAARHTADPEQVAVAARAALAEWRGTALQNLDDAKRWVAAQRHNLDELRGEAWRLLFEAELALGRHVRVLGEIGEPLAVWPQDEALVRLQMLALYRAGRGPRALAVYREFRARVVQEHGIEPGTELGDLHIRILNGDPALDAPAVDSSGRVEAVVGLPARPMLVGRTTEVEQLCGLLAPTARLGTVVISAAVGGLPGVGKTTLAVYAAHEAAEAGWFPGGVLFVDMHGYSPIPLLPEQALFSLLIQLGLPLERLRGTGQDHEVLYRSTLAARARAGQRFLIIADNASMAEQVRPLLPGTPEHRLLITSRHQLGLEGTRQLDMDVLTPEAAVAMLDRHLRGARSGDGRFTTSPDAAAKVAQLCGYLPLALRISAALLAADPGQPVAELADDLADVGRRLRVLDYDGSYAVHVAFDLSYQKLRPELARLFRLLAHAPGPQISTEAAAALTGQPLDTTRRQMQELHRAHLVDTGAPRGWWHFHDLIALYARDRTDRDDTAAEREHALTRLLDHYLATTRAANDHLDPCITPTERAARFADRAQALAWLDAEHPALAATIAHTAGTDRSRYAIDIARHLCDFYKLRKHPVEWHSVTRHALDAVRHTTDRHTHATALNHHGQALAYARRFDEAIAYYDQALQIRREVGDRQGEGSTLNNLGNVYRDLRRFEDAIAHYEQALPIRREVGDRYGEGSTLNNLGNVYRDLRRFEDAIAHYEQAQPIHREVGDRHGEGMTVNNLGLVYRDLRRFEDAIACFEQAQPIHREVGYRQGEGDTLNDLGLVCWQLRRFEDAIAYYEQALPIRREVGDRYREGMTVNNLGLVYAQLERFEEAIACFKQALPIRREVGDQYGEGSTLNNLGAVYAALGRFEEAIACYDQAIPIWREAGDRYGEGSTLNNLGLVYKELQRYDEAIACYEHALPIRREVGDHQGEGHTLNNLGAAYQQMQRFDEVVDAYQLALDVLHEVNDGYEEAMALRGLGEARLAQGEQAEARRWWAEALAVLAQFSDATAQQQTEEIRALVASLDDT
ncbi:tetratricopeptide repeat protein [Kutzneria sp. CA-103260]|uniref:tetratricopeptide repeat protein n=1 Tax=Kutzneria sp. CA-103260 TaxID=2802641 RepID=UPI001BAA3432|nr:tetratricopeptide repeat protein [Kutzneria sp. CA-103260]QUQ68279.1 Photosystem I assembly protein Ycf3 [Kutzneria sp. CA-103260]